MAVDMSSLMKELKPAAGMVLVQTVFAGMNILYKLAANDGMDLRILVAYRHIFGAAFLLPLAFFFERKTNRGITWTVLMQAFFCGLFGGTLTQNLYIAAIKLTTPTFASAITNLLPATTFILAVLFGMEKVGIRTNPGKAKVAGTIVGIGGAMILTFYKGPELVMWHSRVDLLRGIHSPPPAHLDFSSRLIGSLLAIASCLTYAIWLIIQTKMSQFYPCVYSSTALMCLMGGAQSTVFAFFLQKDWNEWKMGFDIRLLTVIYVGVVASGITLTVMTWCIRMKGPLYASVFNPLMVVIVAIMGSFLLQEKLHLGSVLGATFIVIGLYAVVWGKKTEAKDEVELPVQKQCDLGNADIKS
ncbi:WAT1-related protein At1g25270-like [Wolffia australiana]